MVCSSKYMFFVTASVVFLFAENLGADVPTVDHKLQAAIDQLSACSLTSDEQGLLKTRIIAAAKTNHDTAVCVESSNSANMPAIEADLESTKALASGLLVTDLQNSIYKNSYVNAARSFTGLTGQGLNEFCMAINPKQGCSADERSLLGELDVQSPYPDSQSVLQTLNNEIQQLNNLHGQDRVDHLQSLMRPPFLLFYTAAAQKHLGDVLSEKPMHLFTPKSLKAAQQEAHTVIVDKVTNLKQLSARALDSDKQTELIDQLIQADPAAVGQTLAENPAFIPLICDWLAGLEIREAQHEKNKGRVALGTGAGGVALTGAAGVALLFTGGGTVAGILMLGSMVTGLAGGSYEGVQAYELYQKGKLNRASLLAGSGDLHNATISKELARSAALTSLESFGEIGLSIFSLGALKHLAHVGQLDKVASFLKAIFRHPKLLAFIERTKTAASARTKAITSAVWGKLKTFGSNYWKELKARPPWRHPLNNRILWQPRDVTKSKELRKQVFEWVFHPYATAFNRPKKASLLALFFAPSTYLFERAVSKLPEYRDKQLDEKSESMKLSVPGAAFVLDLKDRGLISPEDASKLVIDHDVTLGKWLDHSNDNKVLPRTDDFIQAGLLNQEEGVRLSQIAKQVLQNAIDRYTVETRSSRASYDLIDTLKKDSHFSQRSQAELEILGSVYWPTVRFGQHSDVALAQALTQSASGRGFDLADPLHEKVLGELYNLLNQEQTRTSRQSSGEFSQEPILSIGSIYSMEAAFLDSPGRLGKKVDKAKQILPEKYANIANRPDIPEFARKEELKSDPKVTLNDELDRWNLVFRDSRFTDILSSWKDGQITDPEALLATEGRIAILNGD